MTPRHGFCDLAVWCEGFLRRWKTLTLALGLALVGMEGVRLVAHDKLGDFKPLHQAAVRLRQGEALYQPRGGRTYVYSPAFALLLVPLGLVPLAAAKAVWYGIGVFSIAMSCRLAAKILWPDRPPPTGSYLLMLSGSLYFGHNCLLHGQSTPLMVMLALLSYDFDARGRPWLGGLCLAAAVMIKPFPVLFVAFYLIQKRWRTALAFALIALALLAAPAAYFLKAYPATLRDWHDVAGQQQRAYDISGPLHQSISAFWDRLFGIRQPDPFSVAPTLANAAIAATAAAFLGLAFWSATRRTEGTKHAAFSLFMICWAALPPSGWKHYYFTLLFPCGLLGKVAIEDPAWGRGASRVLMFCAVCILALHVRPRFAPDLMHDASLVLWMGAAVFGFLAVCSARRPSQGT